ncbi:MAG: hypothetical protein HKN11_01615 [Rhizobiales bacterium]|nr:hypothetical protein [Hyphomicrobiales bacterium]
MTKPEAISKHIEILDVDIRDAMASSPALSKDQVADIEKLRNQIRQYVSKGNLEGARSCQAEALTIIKTGAPMKE